MNSEPRIDIVAAALADRARSTIVCALMDGRAYTAKELAYRARVSAQTASFHLRRLVDSGLLARHAQGRNRYYYIAGVEVAEAVEALMAIAPSDHLRPHRGSAGEELLLARSCYDHIAGHLGVLIADRLAEAGALLSRGGAFALTPYGIGWLGRIGLDVAAKQAETRPLVRQGDTRRLGLTAKGGADLQAKLGLALGRFAGRDSARAQQRLAR